MLYEWIFPTVFKSTAAYSWGDAPSIPDSMLHSALAWICTKYGPALFREAWSSDEGNRKCVQLIEHQWNTQSRAFQHLCFRSAKDRFYKIDPSDEDLEQDPMNKYMALVRENEKHPDNMVGEF